jgi:hypothetical protein
MPEKNFQTVRLSAGRHAGPQQGACVVELASMLADEEFSDHPRSVCPVLGAFLRYYNDGVDDDRRQVLYPYAARIVGTAGDRRLRRRRGRLLRTWAHERGAGLRQRSWLVRPFVAARFAAAVAIRSGGAAGRLETVELLDQLLALGDPDRQSPPPEEGSMRMTSELAATAVAATRKIAP